MADPENATREILRRIQSDLAGLKGDVAGNRRLLEEAVEEREALSGYITHAVGLSAETRVGIDTIRQQIKDLEKRLSALEEAR
ncbi:MAG: hypothetical protein AAFQ84_10925 [Pseudomonadota bacterium]